MKIRYGKSCSEPNNTVDKNIGTVVRLIMQMDVDEGLFYDIF